MKKESLTRKIETELSNWNPKEYSGDQITSDPFKTIFVGGLNYSVTERQLKREFERFERLKGYPRKGKGYWETERIRLH